jgi:hypothetical protein
VARQRLDEERGRARQGLTGVATPQSDEDMTVARLVEKFTASLHTHRRHPDDARRRLDQYVLRRPHGFSSLKVAGVARQAPIWLRCQEVEDIRIMPRWEGPRRVEQQHSQWD